MRARLHALAFALFVMACGEPPQAQGPLACQETSQCPAGSRCSSAGRCLPAEAAELRLRGIEPFAPNAVRLSFEQEIAEAPAAASFVVSEVDSGATLSVTGAELASSNRRIVTVFTGFQSPGRAYTLRILGLAGIDGEGVPEAGLTAEFLGFVESTPRTLVLNAPRAVTQGTAFSLTVNAVTVPTSADESVTLYGEMQGELDWELSVPGRVEVMSASSWELGTRIYELGLWPEEPLADGASSPITVRAIARDDPGLNGTSAVIELRGAVGLSHFELDAPPSAELDAAFSLTIRAIGSDGRPFVGFEERVRLAPLDPAGRISPGETPSFVDGSLTLEVRYDALTPRLQVVAEAIDDASKRGVSSLIEVGLGPGGALAPSLTAVALDADRVRLDWSRIAGADQYRLFGAPEGAALVPLGTVVSGVYTRTVDALETGVAYRFRLEGTAGDQVIGVAETVATPKACTPVLAATIDTATAFLAAESPYCLDNPSGDEITASAPLTAEPGVVLLFAAGTSLRLRTPAAALSFVGTARDPIILTSADLAAPWSGLILDADVTPTSFAPTTGAFDAGSRLSHVFIDHAGGGVHGLNVAVPLAINALTLRHTSPASGRSALLVVGALTTLERSRVLQSSGVSFSMQPAAMLRLENNVWAFDEAGSGGAWIATSSGGEAIVTDRGSFYFRNRATLEGGALWTDGTVASIIEDCVFQENLAERGGAGFVNGELEVRRAEFLANAAIGENGAGGGLYVLRGAVFDSQFVDNLGPRGGALIAFNGNRSFTVENVYAAGNRAEIRGGAFAGWVRISRSTLHDNAAPLGGAAALRSGRSGFARNACTSNRADTGGCLALLDSDPAAPFVFTGNNLHDNVASDPASSNVSNGACSPELFVFDLSHWRDAQFGVDSTCASAEVETRVENPVPLPWPACLDMPDAPSCVGASSAGPQSNQPGMP